MQKNNEKEIILPPVVHALSMLSIFPRLNFVDIDIYADIIEMQSYEVYSAT